MKIVFMGSPEFAVPSLVSLAETYTVVGVVSQPDKPAGRGQILTAPPVKNAAIQLGIPLIQPHKLKEPAALAQLETWAPDLMVVAAFGQILRQNVLDLPRLGCINVHASLLPRWRGAAPIQAAILAGDDETGVTIMKMDAGVDTGPILTQRNVAIGTDDTTASMLPRLSKAGAELLMETLLLYLRGEVQPEPQNEQLATRAPMIQKEDALLDAQLPAVDLARKVRAFNPWPGTYIPWQDGILKIHRAHCLPGACEPHQRAVLQGLPVLGTGDGWLVLDEVQPAGKKPMAGGAFLQGARLWKT